MVNESRSTAVDAESSLERGLDDSDVGTTGRRTSSCLVDILKRHACCRPTCCICTGSGFRCWLCDGCSSRCGGL